MQPINLAGQTQESISQAAMAIMLKYGSKEQQEKFKIVCPEFILPVKMFVLCGKISTKI